MQNRIVFYLVLLCSNLTFSQNILVIDEYYHEIMNPYETDKISIKLNIENRWIDKVYSCQSSDGRSTESQTVIKENGIKLFYYFDKEEKRLLENKTYYLHTSDETIEITEVDCNSRCSDSRIKRFNEKGLLHEIIEKDCDGSEIVTKYIYDSKNNLSEITINNTRTRPKGISVFRTQFQYSNQRLIKIMHFDSNDTLYSKGEFTYSELGLLSNLDFEVKGIPDTKIEYKYNKENKLIFKNIMKRKYYSLKMTQKETYEYEYFNNGQIKTECWKQYLDEAYPREKNVLEAAKKEAPDGVKSKILSRYNELGLITSEISTNLTRGTGDKVFTKQQENCWYTYKMK